MPDDFTKPQMDLIRKNDAIATTEATRNNLRAPTSLAKKNDELIAGGQWPEYFYGAFPNFWEIPEYDGTGRYAAGQAPGTHWYHAHKHGSTSLHILNGLAGAFVIESNREGGYDHFIRRALGWGDRYDGGEEKIFVFQQYDPTQNLPRGTNPKSRGIKQVLVNGSLSPTITMKRGEVQLWRFINATEGNSQGVIKAGTAASAFQTSGFGFRQTAQDGVQFSPENYASQPFLSGAVPGGGLVLAGGNRSDLLAQAPDTPGTYAFKNYTANDPRLPGANAILFYVKVTEDRVSPAVSLPTTWPELPAYLKDLRKPVPPQDIPNPNSPVKFQWEKGRGPQTGRLYFPPGPTPTPTPIRNPPNPPIGNPPHFMINDKQFGETGDVVDQCMPLDGLQDWVLENYTTVAHPFHIHINPFQVIKIETPTAQGQYSVYDPKKNNPDKDVLVWQDVIAIPNAIFNADGSITPGRITIRQTYKDYIGTYVLHCHILAHEDRGMMQLVRVVPLRRYPMDCQGHVPAHH